MRKSQVANLDLDHLDKLQKSVLLDSPSKFEKGWRSKRLQVIDWILPSKKLKYLEGLNELIQE